MRLAHITDERRRTARPVRLDALGNRDFAAAGFLSQVADGFHETVGQFRDGNAPGPRVNALQSLPKFCQPPFCKGTVVRVEAAADELACVPDSRIVGALRCVTVKAFTNFLKLRRLCGIRVHASRAYSIQKQYPKRKMQV